MRAEPRGDENADDEWRAGSDGVGELHVFCRECWEREFGEVDETVPFTFRVHGNLRAVTETLLTRRRSRSRRSRQSRRAGFGG